MEVAFSEIGLLPDEFWDLTWREFNLIAKHRESVIVREWDIARTLASWSVSPHTKKPIKPQDLLKLPIDKKSSTNVATLEEFEKVKEMYGKFG